MSGKGQPILLFCVLAGLVFPTLLIAFLYAWRLATMFLPAGKVAAVAHVVGVVASAGGALLVCHRIWRSRSQS
jgi:membrane associated rhomboid family serine protease